MRPVFANSAWVTAPEWAILRGGGWRRRQLPVRYGLLRHPAVGPVLIDTGYTEHATKASSRSFALKTYSLLLRPQLNPAGQIQRLGVSPEDIRLVIVTHFHADHVSGLNAFPNARFLASGTAWARISAKSHRQNMRHGVFTELLPKCFTSCMTPIEGKPLVSAPNLPEGYDLFEDGSVLGIPLPGHADGHFGLYFRDSELLYATDTQWLAEALPQSKHPRLLSRLVSDDTDAGAQSSDVVVRFQGKGGKILLCHDDTPSEFDLPEDGV